MKGDVVVVPFPFPFSNLAEAKRRPALVVASSRGTTGSSVRQPADISRTGMPLG